MLTLTIDSSFFHSLKKTFSFSFSVYFQRNTLCISYDKYLQKNKWCLVYSVLVLQCLYEKDDSILFYGAASVHLSQFHLHRCFSLSAFLFKTWPNIQNTIFYWRVEDQTSGSLFLLSIHLYPCIVSHINFTMTT